MYKSRVRALVKKYGYNTVSFQSVMDGFLYYQSSFGIDGFIAYVHVGKVFFVAGDPICQEDDLEKFIDEFKNFCKKNKVKCVFITATSRVKKIAGDLGFGCLKIGEEPIFDLDVFSLDGHDMKANRNYVRRAQKEGVEVMKLEKDQDSYFRQIEDICTLWLENRKIKELSFLLKLDPLDDFSDKIIFIAKKGEEVLACLTCIPIPQREGWYFEDMVYKKQIPVGTTQLLIFESLEYLKKHGYKLASFGTSPLVGISKEKNSKYWKTQTLQKFAYKYLNTFYNFSGLYAFKKGLYPTQWESKYYCFYPPRFTLKLIVSTVKLYYPTGISGVFLTKIQKIIFKRKKGKK